MDVRDANILVHSRMAAEYNEREPHFRPENQARVRARLERLRRAFGGRLLDVGCGTGFIIDLAAELFDDVQGVDLTPAMLEGVRPRPNVRVQTADAARLPFPARLSLSPMARGPRPLCPNSKPQGETGSPMRPVRSWACPNAKGNPSWTKSRMTPLGQQLTASFGRANAPTGTGRERESRKSTRYQN